MLANLLGILAANYITFYILDHYNPGMHFVTYSTFPLTQYLHVILAALAVITGILYLILFRLGAFKKNWFRPKRLVILLIADILVAGAFAMTVNTHAFDWLHLRDITEATIVAVATPEPTATCGFAVFTTASARTFVMSFLIISKGMLFLSYLCRLREVLSHELCLLAYRSLFCFC